MAFLNENEWIRLNEIAYNISFIYTVEEMQHEILNRWLPFLISYDSAIFARISTAENGSYQFLVLSNATQPEEATKFGLDMNNTIDYDFEDAKENSAKYVEDFFAALGSSSDSADSSRFLTE